MLVFSHKAVFIKNDAALLWVTGTCGNVQGHVQRMRKVQGHLQLQSSVHLFDIAFSIKKFSFCGALFKRILA